MRAEGIGVYAAPTRVGPSRTLVARTDTVTPVILVGETATGPAQYGNIQFFQRSNNVVTQAARVRDRRVFAHPQAIVDQTAEVLGKLAVDVTVDGPSWLVQPDRERGFVRPDVLSPSRKRDKDQSQDT